MSDPIDNFNKLVELDKPWWCIPAIEHIESLLSKDMRVFEYGSGSSSIWFSKRVKEVISQEAHAGFFEFMTEQTASIDNSKIIYANQHNEDEYLGSIKEHGKFDLILIDAAMRIKCLDQAKEFLTEDGIIVFDNSGWDKFQQGLTAFEQSNSQLKTTKLSGMKYIYEVDDGEEETRIYSKI